MPSESLPLAQPGSSSSSDARRRAAAVGGRRPDARGTIFNPDRQSTVAVPVGGPCVADCLAASHWHDTSRQD